MLTLVLFLRISVMISFFIALIPSLSPSPNPDLDLKIRKLLRISLSLLRRSSIPN